MKGLAQYVVVFLSVSTLLVACGKGADGGGGTGNPVPTIYPDSYNSQTYRGTMGLVSRNLYQIYLKENGFCGRFFGFNTCPSMDRGPVVNINFSGTVVDVSNGIGAQVTLQVLNDSGFPQGQIPYSTNFYYINNNTQIESNNYGSPYNRSYNGEVIITLTAGKPGDATIRASLSYRGGVFGTVTLTRSQQQTYPNYPNYPNYPPIYR